MILSRRNIIVGSIVLLLATLALAWAMRGTSVVDQYVAELRAKGERMYFTDPPYPKMTNGTPGLDKLVKAADKIWSPVSIDMVYTTNAGSVEVAWRRTQPRFNPSASCEWSKLAAIVRTNEQALAEIRESLGNPEPDFGWQTNVLYRRTFVEQRIAAQFLGAAVISALHEKNNEAALTNLLALIQIAKLEREEPTLVAQMVRISEAGVGLSATWQALQFSNWTDGQLSAMQAGWESVDLLSALELGFSGERMRAYEFIRSVRQTGTNVFNWRVRGGPAPLSDRMRTRLWRVTVADQDEMFYLQTMQRFLEHGRLARQHKPLFEVEQLFGADAKYVEATFGERFASFRYPLSALSIPNFGRSYEYCIHAEVQRRLTLAAIAIARFKTKYGALPTSLKPLVPEFCPEVPLDPMDWKPLRYRLNSDATFTLYSIGRNGVDDGGNPQRPKGNATGVFPELDIVWPRAAATHH